MQRNRAINGAENPGSVASSDAAAQRQQRVLSTNDMSLGSPQQRTFEPNLETLDAINRRHKAASVDGNDSGPTYDASVPYGPLMGGGESPLR